MPRLSTFSLFLLSVSLLVAVFGVGLGNAQKDATTTDVSNNNISILPVPGDDSSTTTDEPPTLTSEEPTTTSEPETSTTVAPPPQETTTSSTTTEDPTTKTTPNKPPPKTSTTSQAEPTTSSKKNNPPPTATTTSSKHLTTQVVTVSGTTIHQTVSASEPTSDSNPTEAPGLNAGDKNDDSDSGLDDSQKNIIIGVVVGVGGAILLGGLAVVAWRVWGRKKNDGYDDDAEDMMSAGTAVGSAGRDKASSPSNAGNSPFKSTLDQYHNPGPVNAASNF